MYMKPASKPLTASPTRRIGFVFVGLTLREISVKATIRQTRSDPLR